MARIAILAFLFGYGPGVVAQDFVEYPLPPVGGAAGQVAGLALGPDGNVWFTENLWLSGRFPTPAAGNLGNIRDDGIITAYPCAIVGGPASGIGGPAATQDGNLWITQDQVGLHALTPCLPGVPGTAAALPSYATSLIVGPDGNLWFVLTAPASVQIGRSTTDGVLTTLSLPTGSPSFLAAGPDGNVWFTDYTNGKVGHITTSGAVTWFGLPTANAGPSAITAGSDGNLWFIEETANQIGRITPTGSVTEYPIPTPASQPSAIALGADGAIWFTEWIGRIGRITAAGAFSEIPVPYPNAHPALLIGKPDGTIWFTDRQFSSNDRIGRFSPSADCGFDPQTLCLDMGAFSVTASFQRPSDAAFSPATAAALTGNTGYFWFFDPANVEMTVKVLDGCSINGHYWVFAGGMTNVGVRWKVVRSQTGAVRNYSSPPETAFQPVQDTAAFPCP